VAEGDLCRCARELAYLLTRVSRAMENVAGGFREGAKMELQEVRRGLKGLEDCLGMKLDGDLERILKKIEEDVDRGYWGLAISGFYPFFLQLPLKACKKW